MMLFEKDLNIIINTMNPTMLHIISNPSAEYTRSRNERIHGIYRYWDSKRQGRRMPSRADMDPVEIPEYLSNVIPVDVF